jgi:plastocyanin
MSPQRPPLGRRVLWNMALLLLIGGALFFGVASSTGAEECARIHEVMMTHVFTPRELVITAGECVRFVNRHGIEHSAIGRDREFNTGTLMPGSSALIKFDTPGEIPYVCGLHPPMVGKLVITPGR